MQNIFHYLFCFN